MFKTAWWRFWKPDGTAIERYPRPRGCWDGPARARPPKFDRVVISLDAAFKATSASDFVVFQVWGAHQADRFLLEQVRGRMTFTETVAALQRLVQRWPMARRKLVEDKANGSAVIDTLQRQISGIVAVNPSGGKEARAAAVQPQVESGNVYLPEGAGWLDEFVDEFAIFPRGRHDDQVDALTQALLDMERAETGKIECFRMPTLRR